MRTHLSSSTSRSTSRAVVAALLVTGLLGLAGCSQQKVAAPEPPPTAGPDYSRPLPDGASALRPVTDPARLPDFRGAFDDRDIFLLDALDQSLRWYAAPSSKKFFPIDGVTHEQARQSVAAFRDLLDASPDAASFQRDLLERFTVYESVGYDGEGTVLFTGYYAPIFEASRERTDRFRFPLYTRPDDLVTDPLTGEPQGRRVREGVIVPYYTRREIEQSNMFAGNELVWLPDALSAYIVHINGSAKLHMTDGTTIYVGYAGKTDRPYRGLGRAMLDAGLLSRDELSLAAIRKAYQRDPQAVQELMYRNESYVFFTEYRGENWPAGSLGVRVTRQRSLATDKRIYPRGAVTFVDTEAVTFSGGRRAFQRFMLDQDTGGAIRAPGRADLFMGVGPAAEILAGGQYAEGRLYYLFLKPEYVEPETAVAAR